MPEQLADNAQTSISGSINNTSNPVTFSVASTTRFPTTGNFRVLIDSEILLVTSVSGSNFTATRAQEGTSIASHAGGATITQILTSGAMRQLYADYNLTGTFSALPTAGYAGRRFSCTDTAYQAVDSGTSWAYWWNGFPVNLPYNDSNWSWKNQSTASLDQSKGTLRLLNATSNGGAYGLNAYVRPVPGSTPYTLEWAFYLYFTPASGSLVWAGPCLYNSSSGKFVSWRFEYTQNANLNTYVEYYTSATAYASDAVTWGIQNALEFQPYWMKMVDDGTNRNWYLGPNQWNPALLFQESNTNFLAATHYGIQVSPYNNPVAMELIHLAGG